MNERELSPPAGIRRQQLWNFLTSAASVYHLTSSLIDVWLRKANFIYIMSNSFHQSFRGGRWLQRLNFPLAQKPFVSTFFDKQMEPLHFILVTNCRVLYLGSCSPEGLLSCLFSIFPCCCSTPDSDDRQGPRTLDNDPDRLIAGRGGKDNGHGSDPWGTGSKTPVLYHEVIPVSFTSDEWLLWHFWPLILKRMKFSHPKTTFGKM